MNLGKSLMFLVVLFSVLGLFTFANVLVVSAQNETGTTGTGGNSYGGQTWIDYNTSNVRMTDLTATITVTIKNTKNHVVYFKISQLYTDDLSNGPIKFIVDWTDPQAERMIDPVSPELGGDYGWSIQPGETKTVSFKVSAVEAMGETPAWISNAGAVSNTYWPLIPDMGLYASWFMPNEIEMLNPDLDLKSWKGTFCFTATNFAEYAVAGIIRGPIIPTDSKLTYSDPTVTFQDRDLALNTNVAAWDIHLSPDESVAYTYTYEWPIGQCTNCSNASAKTNFGLTNATPPTTVPSRSTGVPYGLLAIAVVVVAAGVGYAKFLR
jgi:hypothetical protein